MTDPYKEQLLKRELAYLDFNKLEPAALTEFVTLSTEESKKMKQSAAKYRESSAKVLELLKSKNLIHKLDLSNEDLEKYADVFTDAVDGSMQKYPRPDGGWLYFYSVARIRYSNGYNSDVQVNVTPTIKTINTIDPKGAGAEAEEFMMNMETEALKVTVQSRKKENNGILFLDGPVIDPPFSAPKEYLHRRTFACKEAFVREIQVVGIVKRIQGTLFINQYRSHFSNKEAVEFENLMSDKNFAVHVLTNFLESDRCSIAYTEPVVLAESSTGGTMVGKEGRSVAEKYHEEGVDVITFLMLNGYVTNPIRVDIAVPNATSIDKKTVVENVIRHVVRWAAPGRHLPIPVILAHEKCNIGQGAAEILFTEFISGSKTDNEAENIIQIKMMGDVH